MHESSGDQPLVFEQIHIDAARNATDDFNPFHDPGKCSRISNNPFDGPIVLGFQLESLVEYRVTRQREQDGSAGSASFPYRNYHFTFAGALRSGVACHLAIKPTLRGRHSDGSAILSNRVALRSEQGLLMLGQVRDSAVPMVDIGEPPTWQDARPLDDRSLLQGGEWFHKRKFMINSNAKNLLSGSLADQAYYFDELEDRIRFPDMYPVSLVSCALLERGHALGHDFYANPMVYTTHHISVHQGRARALRSSDQVHLLVSLPESVEPAGGLGHVEITQQRHRCFGVLEDGAVLFRADIMLAPLELLRSQLVSAAAAASTRQRTKEPGAELSAPAARPSTLRRPPPARSPSLTADSRSLIADTR